MANFDLVIRNGMIVDGSGAPPYQGDVGVVDGVITEIGRIPSHARQDIDADGLTVAPGFIDGHTHMDAQMFWEPLGRSSCFHGITSVVIGNCGFTLAPSKDDERHLVVRNLERAEEIPAESMALGIPWSWETFREYLDAIDRLPKAINYASQIGHSALRTWAMGERAFDELATEDDLMLMQRELTDALAAGAMGFTTSRALHTASDGRPVASRIAAWQEVCALVKVLEQSHKGVFQLAHDTTLFLSDDRDLRAKVRGELRELAVETGVPVLIGLNQAGAPEGDDILDYLAEVNAAGGKMYGMSHSRGISELFSFKTRLPFDHGEHWEKLRQSSVREQERLLRDPAVRKELVAEAHRIGITKRSPDRTSSMQVDRYDDLIYMENVVPPNPSLEDVARERNADPIEVLIDLGLETRFTAMFARFGRDYRDDLLLKSMRDPRCAMTFSDNGAHVTRICDCSIQTYMLAYWMRGRGAFTLPEAIRMITSVPATIWSLKGRGLVKQGFIADLNVFDPDEIAPAMPTVESDFPGGAKHLQQKAVGIEATIVAGEVTLRGGDPTGALPGTLIRV